MNGLADFRKSLGLAQAKLAGIASIRQATLSLIETGKTRPHPGTVLVLARALDLDGTRMEE